MEIIEELKRINKVESGVFNETLALMAKRTHESTDWLISVDQFISNDENVESLVNFINFLGDYLIDARDFNNELTKLDDTIDKLSKDDASAKEAWAKVKNSLDQLTPYFLDKKLQTLQNRFNRVTDIEITTDVRPFFNLEKTEIINNLYVAILKIKTVDDKNYICEFYDDKLQLVLDELIRTKEKFDALKVKYGDG